MTIPVTLDSDGVLTLLVIGIGIVFLIRQIRKPKRSSEEPVPQPVIQPAAPAVKARTADAVNAQVAAAITAAVNIYRKSNH